MVLRGGLVCGRETIGGSAFCRLRSHHETREGFEQAVEACWQELRDRTLPRERFNLIEIDGDGACLYSSLSYFLLQEQTALEIDPYDLQIRLKEWLYESRDEKTPFYDGEQTVEELVLSTHESVTSMEDYRSLYHIPASLRKGRTRWGGLPEQFAFSEIFSCTVLVYNLVTLDRRQFRTIEASLRCKEPRYNLIQAIGEGHERQVHLLYSEKGDAPHYSLLLEAPSPSPE